jgi:hypothetical protein
MKFRKYVTGRWAARALITSAVAGVASLATILPAAAATSTQILSNQTFPHGGVVLTGADGQQHLWTPDHINGVCRVDQNADGSYTLDQSSCLLAFGGSPAIKPGQLAYDGHYLYIPDMSSKSIGVGMVAYDPAANGGRGGLSLFDRRVLAPNCGLGGNLPWGAALGPDNNLYLSFKKNGNITRVKNPAAFSGNCGDVQNIGLSGDTRKSFALAFAGTNLWETNNNGVGVIPNATAIVSGQVHSNNVFLMAGANAITSDQNGHVYVGTTNSVLVFDGVNGSTPATLATGFAFVSGLSVDGASVTSPTLPASRIFVGDDPSNGLTPLAGRIWVVNS